MRETNESSGRQLTAEQLQPDQDDNGVQHFTLAGVLPPGCVLAVQPHLGIVAILSCEAGVPHVQSMHHFGAVELLVLLPLLTSYPRYCHSELLLARFVFTRVDAAAIEHAREQLDKASEEGTWEQVMKPARNVLSRCRPRLADLGIKVISRPKRGYQLAAAKATLA